MLTTQLALFKTCQRCHVEKSRSEFNKDKRYADGLQPWCRSCYREYHKQYNNDPDNHSRIAERSRKWFQDNIERLHAMHNAWTRDRWRNDPEYRKRKNKQSLELLKTNPQHRARHNLNTQRRNNLRRSKHGGWFTTQEWLSLCERYGNVCLACGKPGPLTQDHVIPLSKGGSNSIDNIQPLCDRCNKKKGTQIIDYRK